MANIKINGITYSGVDSIKIPNASGSGQTTFSIPPTTQTKTVTPSTTQQTVAPDSDKLLSYVVVNAIPAKYGDTTSATATASQILSGQKAVIKNSSGNAELTTGTMANRGAVAGTISTKAGTYTIPAGYHNGSGSVGISSTEQAKIIAGNIKNGVTILGVTGNYGGGTSARIESNKTASPSTQTQVITPSTGYDYLAQVTVNAMPEGSVNAPTATEGNINNHSITITPSVSYTTGYITGGTKSGTSVTVTASDLVDGTMTIEGNGTGIDVTNYKYVNVDVSGGGGGGGGLPTTIVAGDTPIWADMNNHVNNTSSGSTATSYSVKKAGTYRIKASVFASSQTASAEIRVNGTQISTAAWSGAGSLNHADLVVDRVLSVGDVVSVFIKGGSGTRYAFCNAFALCIEWNTGLN